MHIPGRMYRDDWSLQKPLYDLIFDRFSQTKRDEIVNKG